MEASSLPLRCPRVHFDDYLVQSERRDEPAVLVPTDRALAELLAEWRDA